MEPILQAEKLTKKYGKKVALNGIDIKIEKGKIIGFLGPNGSGKSTFLKIVAGMLKKTSGSITIGGKKPGVETKKIVSYLPDKNFLYNWMKIKDAIEYYNDFFSDFKLEKSKELLEFMHLNENSYIKELSKGMLEKLYLTLILSREAELYILDEPLAGVDPSAREKIIDAIINNYRENSTIIITTHLVKDIERVFDDIVFLKDGNIELQGNAEEIRIEKGKSIDELFREVFYYA